MALFWNINGIKTRKVVFLELLAFLKSKNVAVCMLYEINLDQVDYEVYNDMSKAAGYCILSNIKFRNVKNDGTCF